MTDSTATGVAGKRRLPKLVTDLAALSGGDFVAKLLGFVAFAWLARVLSVADYGAVEVVVTLDLFFSRLVDGGLGVIGVRELMHGRRDASRLVLEIPAVRLCVALLAAPTMLVASRWVAQPAPPLLLVAWFAASLVPFALTQIWLTQARERMAVFSLGQILRTFVFALLVLGLVRGDDQLAWVGVAEVAAATAAMLFFADFQRRSFGWRRAPIELRRLARLARTAAPVGLANTVWGLYQFAPVVLVATLVGGEETAWIGAAMRVLGSLLILSVLYHFNLFPEVALRVHKQGEAFRTLVGSSMRLVAWAAGLGALLLSCLAPVLLRILFGAPYAAAAPALAVLAWVVPVTMVSGHARWALVAGGHQRSLLTVQTFGAVVMWLIGLFLTPRYQSIGASVAMLVASLGVMITALGLARQSLDNFPSRRDLLPPAGAALLALAVHRFAALGPWASAALCGAIFVLAAAPLAHRLRADLATLVGAKARHEPTRI